MKIVGVTGGIAVGKSTVAGFLAKRGAAVIDADEIAQQVVLEPEVHHRIVARLGGDILRADGGIDRRKLAKVVFSDPQKLKVLNEIVHPPVIGIVKERVEELKESLCDGVVVLDVPLLVETDLLSLVDLVVVVTASEEAQLGRLKKKSLSMCEAKSRISAQIPQGERLRHADYVIENDGTLEALERKVDDLWKKIVG